MGVRIYYGRLLRAIHYSGEYPGHPAEFRFQLIRDYQMLGVYQAPTIAGIIEQLRTDGHQVWGSDPLDYALPPDNALEYVLMEHYLLSEGATSDEITEMFSLRLPDEKEAQNNDSAR